jgi:hypothetical protein
MAGKLIFSGVHIRCSSTRTTFVCLKILKHVFAFDTVTCRITSASSWRESSSSQAHNKSSSTPSSLPATTDEAASTWGATSAGTARTTSSTAQQVAAWEAV